MKTFRLEFVEPPILSLKFVDPPVLNLDFAAQAVEVVPDPYVGDYTVIPKFREQVLPTHHKNMAADVVVTTIPVEQVSNPGGGYTITIGGLD